jgi:hypothetical protein
MLPWSPSLPHCLYVVFANSKVHALIFMVKLVKDLYDVTTEIQQFYAIATHF